VEMWYLMVQLSGFAPAGWDKPRACGDLLARAEAGIIDVSITDLSLTHAGRPSRAADIWQKRLRSLIDDMKGGEGVLHEKVALPMPVRMTVKESISGLFPIDGYLLVTPRLNWQKFNIHKRYWLFENYRNVRPPVPECSYISSSYLIRDT
jgi:hypothetical protein